MSSEVQIITEQDFFTCESGLMPARLQSCQPTAFREDGQFRYITSKDVCTQSCIDFSCSKLMLLMAAVAALVAAFIALCVATGGAAAVAMTCIAAGAIAGGGGAVLGGIVGSLICGQKAAPARMWLLSKQDFTIHGITAITSEHIMVCTVFSFVGLPPQQIKHAPNIQSWGQAITQGVTGFIGKIFEGMMAGACIGACVGGINVLATSGGWAGAGRGALQFLKSIPANISKNYLMTLGKFGGWTSNGIKIAAGIRGGMGVLGAAQSYGETGELLSTDTLAGFGQGIIGIELGVAISLYNLFTPERSWGDVVVLGTIMLPGGQVNKPRTRVKGLSYEAPKPQIIKVTAKNIEEAIVAREKAISAAKDLPQSSKQTVASDRIMAVSGFVKDRISNLFRTKHIEIKDVSFETVKEGSPGYKFTNSGKRDNNIAGSNKGCHAEKQVIAETGDPTGVSKPMCKSCQQYAQNRAETTGKPVVVAEPGGVRIYEQGKKPVYIPDGKSPQNYGYE